MSLQETLLKKFKNISVDVKDLNHFGKDWTRFKEPDPLAVIFPKTTEEVSQILKFCSQENIAVVPSGGRTGLSGGALAAHKEMVLSLTQMNQLCAVDVLSATVKAQAGVITQAVHEHCHPLGLTWPVDFGSKGSSTVGGNIATNAGGINVIRYGMCRHWILGMTVVLMNGEILQINGSLEKNNTGLDLKHLFIGSEGTLGVVTEAVLKLARLEKNTQLFFFTVPTMDQVFKLLERTRAADFQIHAFEAFSKNCFLASLQGLHLTSPFATESEYYVLLELKVDQQESLDEFLQTVFEQNLVIEGVPAQTKEVEKNFWRIRESIAEFLALKGLNHNNDVSVPVEALQSFLKEWEALFSRKYPQWELYVFGHFGDGNLHIHAVKPLDMGVAEFQEKAASVDFDLFSIVKAFKGSVSAEHGIGVLKKPYLHFSKSAEEIRLMTAIKNLLDPQNLLNPGKILST